MLIDGTKRKQEDQNAMQGTAPPMIGGQPSGMMKGTATTFAGQTTTNSNPTSSGGFTNLNKYINANKGANNQTIGKLANTAQQTASEGQQAITGAKTVGTNLQRDFDTARSDQEFINQAIANPTSADIDRFTRLRTSFNAPQATPALTQFDAAQTQANLLRDQKANELRNLTTSGGLTDYLRTQRQSPRYSQGSQSLDKFLIRGTDEGAKTLENINTQAQQLSQEPADFAQIRSGIQSRAQALNPNLMNSGQVQTSANQAYNNYITATNPEMAYDSNDPASNSRYAQVTRSWTPERQNQAQYGQQEIGRQTQRIGDLNRALRRYNEIGVDEQRSLMQYTNQDLKDIIQLVDPNLLQQVNPLSESADLIRLARGLNINNRVSQAQTDLGNLESQYNPLIRDYNQIQNQQWTGADLLTPEQIARVNALASLSGQDSSTYLNRVYARPAPLATSLPQINQTFYTSDGQAVQTR